MLILSLLVSTSDILNPSDCIFSKDFDLNLDDCHRVGLIQSDYQLVLSKLRNVGDILKSLGLFVQIRTNVSDVVVL